MNGQDRHPERGTTKASKEIGVIGITSHTGDSRDPLQKSELEKRGNWLFWGRNSLKQLASAKTHPETQHTHPIDRSENLRFRVCCVFGISGALCSPLRGRQNTHPKTQHIQNRRFSERSILCIFGGVAFLGAFCSPLKQVPFTPKFLQINSPPVFLCIFFL